MLRLLDARTGAYTEVRPSRPGLLRLCAHLAGAQALTGLRVLLAADLLARVAEMGSLQAVTVLAVSGEAAGHVPAVEGAAAALGIRSPAGHARVGDAEVLLGGPADVHLVSDRAAPHGQGGRPGAVVALVGAALMPGTGAPGEATAVLAPWGELDPLAVRLALMAVPAHQQAELTAGMLAGAADTVAGWRRRVARWAEQPSRPVPAALAETIRAAFGEVDIPAAIALLRSLADDDAVPAGARFETFLFVDRVLGLDLPRDIGKPA